jgi:transketolase
MRKTCLDKVYELAQRDERVVFVGSDLGFGTLKDFRRQLPDRFIMEGINEAHAVGMAAGLAMEGRVVYVNTIATFITRRCYEQVALDACMHNLPVRLIGNGGGLVYAPLGSTHLAIEDLAIFRALPNMTIVAPADAEEMARLMPLTLDHPGPMYIRLGKGYDPVVTRPDPPFAIGRGYLMRKGEDVLAVTTGVGLQVCLAAAETAAGQGVSMAVLHLPTVKPLDAPMLLDLAAGVKAVLSVEEHTVIGGLGGAVAEVLAEARWDRPPRFKRLGIPDVFPDKYGTQNGLMALYGLSPEGVARAAKELLGA